MKRYGGLYKKICEMDNLKKAHKKARKGKGYYREVMMVDSNPDYYLKQIQNLLLTETYEVSEYQVSVIQDKDKERVLMKLPYYPDRIIQWAVMLQIEDIFVRNFCTHTCASIKNRGTKRATALTRKYTKEYEYCLKIDIKKFYPNINHSILKKLLRRKFKDKMLLRLFDKIIDSVGGDKGIPIGSYLSQFFANFYLSYFDHWLKEELKIKGVVRYMDDIVIFGNDKSKLRATMTNISQYLQVNLKLEIKHNYQIFPPKVRGVDFVGFRHFGLYVLLRKRIAKALKRKIRKIMKKNMLSCSDICSIGSYRGRTMWCNCYRLSKKYLDFNIKIEGNQS